MMGKFNSNLDLKANILIEKKVTSKKWISNCKVNNIWNPLHLLLLKTIFKNRTK